MTTIAQSSVESYLEQPPVEFLVVGGCPRSGTTALLSLLNACEDIGLIPEYNLPNAVKNIEKLFYKEKSIAGKQWIGDINANQREGADILVGDFLKYVPSEDKSFHAMNRFFFESVFGRSLKIVGEKLPRYWDFDIDYLNAKVGPIKIIHIVRDPMVVMNSFMHRARLTEQKKDQWKYNDIRGACNLWSKAWNVMVAMKQKMQEQMLIVRYEDFFDKPAETEAKLGAFLGVDSSNFLSFVGEKQGELTAFTDYEREIALSMFGELHRSWDQGLEQLMKQYPKLTYIEYSDEADAASTPASAAQSIPTQSIPTAAKQQPNQKNRLQQILSIPKNTPVIDHFCREKLTSLADMPWPDLSQHPEFNCWLNNDEFPVPAGANAAVFNLRSAIEGVEQEIAQDPLKVLNCFLKVGAETQPGSPFQAVHVAISMLNTQYSGAGFAEFEAKIIHKQFSRLLEECRRYLMVKCIQSCNQRQPLSKLGAQIVENLSQSGAVPFGIGEPDMALLRSTLHGEVEALRAAPANTSGVGYDRATRLLPESHPKVYEILNAYFRDWKLLEASQYYFGVEQVIHAVALHVCRETDQHYTMTCQDLAPTDLVNLHFDPKDGMMKCILYLDEVELEDGPFSYIEGSHRWYTDPIAKLAAKANGVTNYLASPEHRRAFMRLPEALRYCCIMGSMIPSDSDLSNQLASQEIHYTSKPYGQAIFFDPSGLHRGGLAKGSGERISLQIMLRPSIQGVVLPHF